MHYEILTQGFVTRREPGSATAVAMGPRCALTGSGDIVCTAQLASALGINDYQTVLWRSSDGGTTWNEEGALWPELAGAWSTGLSVSRAANRELFCFGTREPIDEPGESYWCEATLGLKPNELVWSRSGDEGRSWSPLEVIPMPIPGAAEAPGPMCIAADGKWHCCYSPYNTFDPGLVVDRNQVVLMTSSDEGQSWSHRSMLRFAETNSNGCIAWVIELSDGRLLGTCWHVSNDGSGKEYPNPYALSNDGGATWTAAQATGIMGQTPSLAALPGGRVLFAYNQRRHGETGVGLAIARPDNDGFDALHDELVWRAETPTQGGSSGEYSLWEDFAFGEPSTTLLPDGTVLLVLWCAQPSGQGIRYVRLKIIE